MRKLNLAIIGQGRSGYSIHGEYLLTEEAKKLFNVVAVVALPERAPVRVPENAPVTIPFFNFTPLISI